MLAPRFFGRRRSNAFLLAALLVGTLVLATMLAYEAHDAAQSHRAAAERTLNDYAAVAAWELVAGVNEELQSTFGAAFAPIARTRASSPYELLPSPEVLASNTDVARGCGPRADTTARFYFRIDFRDGSLATSGVALSPAMRTWLTDTIISHSHNTYRPDWTYSIVVGGPAGDARSTIAYAVKYADHGVAIAAYGMRACDDRLRLTIADVVTRRALLPASVTGDVANDSIVAVDVRDAHGTSVYESGAVSMSTYAATVPLEQAGDLTAHITIRSRAIAILALGALPGSRVPLLVALLTLTAAMIGVTIMQLRREHELSRLRADFISSVSHELRTPLSQILLFAETLSLGRVRSDAERHSATEVIVQEGRRLMHLVENILHFSRADRSMTRLGVERLDLNEAVAAVIDDWRPLISNADVHVRLQLGEFVFATADRSALRQMILNLLDNAVKYGPRPQTVTVGTSTSGDRSRIWVDDEGEGIPPHERERVWTSFYRLRKHASSAVAGSGIGLYVVRELARLHGGRAWVETAAGGGARFVIEIPA